MSADNQHVVSELHDRSGKYGIFHIMGDMDPPSQWYTLDNTVNNQEYNSATEVIIAAHKIERDNPTEYGVYVNSAVLNDSA